MLRSSVDGAASMFQGGSAVEHMTRQLLATAGQAPSRGEARAWRHSLPLLLEDLRAGGFSKVEVLVEHQLPLTSKRVDAVLAGVHPRTGDPSYVFVELKQWSHADIVDGDGDHLVRVDAYGDRPVLHPVDQVAGYLDYTEMFLPALADAPERLAGVAYLHNATEHGIAPLRARPTTDRLRLYSGERKADLLGFLASRLSREVPGADAADQLLSMRIAPSRQLLAVAAEELQQRECFVLLAEQRLAYEVVLAEVERARAADRKSVVVIAGGPGSGKSVIALSLMGELARQGRTVLHATGSRSFTMTLRQVAGRGSTRFKQMFKYFNQFMEAEPNSLDVLILDEAHRIRETSANRYTKAHLRSGRAQVDELMSAARVPVFLLDEHQVVRPGEMGTVEDITSHAESRGLDVRVISLDSQFRCGGSAAYLEWVQLLLGLREGGPVAWEPDGRFEVVSSDSPSSLEAMLERKRDEGFGARMTAGYCWRWSDPEDDGSLVRDITIGDWSRPWNLRGDRATGGAPPAALWATDPTGFGQVGCVYTAQGFEYDWNGVIIGPDLVWRGDRWVAVREANRDPDFRSRKTVSDAEFERLVLNVYKVLLTRGMIGTAIYSCDPETQRMLGSIIPR